MNKLNELNSLSKRERQKHFSSLSSAAQSPIPREIIYTFFSGKFDIWSKGSLAWLGVKAREMMLDPSNVTYIDIAMRLPGTQFKIDYDNKGCWIDIDPISISMRINSDGSVSVDG